ncbi:MAG: NAD(P)/FAD-dependent oxidoreductase [Gammaproteobacteria bacterium]|nr:NAD(P)/FAD-dependent oxidoreductase [Gammaproteobacteria bacterium]
MNSSATNYDIIVIGGGPVGTTAATLLSEKGYRVCLLEKTRHPRFHIGESLLPMNLPILKRLGVLDEVKKIGIIKHGAEFNALDPVTEQWQQVTFYFKKAFNQEYTHAYEVKRSEFDSILFKNCKNRGVQVLDNSQVTQVQFIAPEQVAVHYKNTSNGNKDLHTLNARFVIDASGRDSLLSRRLKLKQKNPQHQSSAIFGHFSNVERRTGMDEGNISLYWFEHGWFWLIPLSDGSMSVGAVCWPEYLKTLQGSTEEFLWQTIHMNSAVAARMKNAKTLGEIRATGNFAYTSRRMWGRDFLLLGDAFAFVDPVFSSGVYLGMSAAEKAAETIDQCLKTPERAPQLCGLLEKRIRNGINEMCWFIYRFTSPVMQRLFMNPRNDWQVESAVISMLAGDIFDNKEVKLRLKLFHLIYYTHAARMLPETIKSWWRRRKNVQVIFDRGTMPEDNLSDIKESNQ